MDSTEDRGDDDNAQTGPAHCRMSVNPRTITDRQRRDRLAWRHRLVPTARAQDPCVIADDLVALHSSDPVTVFLSVCARQSEPSIASVEDALYNRRSLLRHHAMRRTIWVMTPATAQHAHAACTRKLAAAERRRLVRYLDGEEAWLDKAIDEIAALLAAADGPMTARAVGLQRPWLTRKLTMPPSARNAARVSAHTRVLQLGGFEAVLLRGRPLGSWIGSQYAWALMKDWIDTDFDAHEAPAAAAALAGSWLWRFGPALPEDLRWWAGWTKAVTRRALADIGAVPVRLECGDGVASQRDDDPAEDPGPWVALLPGLDPTAMGWKRRDWYLDGDVAARVTDRFGNIGPTVWADGRIVGGWVQCPDGTIAVEILRPLKAQHARLLEDEIERLQTTVGETRFRVRFPAPNQKSLL